MDNRWIIYNRGTHVYIYKYIDNVDVYLYYDSYIHAINCDFYSYVQMHEWLPFLVAQLGKNPPAKWETLVRSLGLENPLVKGKATHSSFLA